MITCGTKPIKTVTPAQTAITEVVKELGTTTNGPSGIGSLKNIKIITLT